MPQTISKYKIFLASPSDVSDARDSINEVISELNNTYGTRANVFLELIKWETHSAPAISDTHVQNIIDSDIGDDYDLFIGILWKKFGTPTNEYKSGTEQEFHNAYSRYKQNPKLMQILFYFDTSTPLSLKDINTSELEKVNNFKSEIGEKSILYWEYNTIKELQKFLRIHIPKRIDSLRESNNVVSINSVLSETESATISQVEELGYLDYQDIYLDAFEGTSEALSRITESTKWVGDEINKKATELHKLKGQRQEIGRKELRDFCKRTADIMNAYAMRIEPEIPLYFSNFEKAVDALSNIITIHHSDLSTNNKEDAEANMLNVKTIIDAIEGANSGMNSFLSSMNHLPRMEKELNQSRINVENKVGDFINKLEISKSITFELYKNIPQV